MGISKGLLRRAALIVVLALLICAAVLAALPFALKPALNRWLPGLLADDGASVHIRQLSWSQISIDELTLPLPDGTLIQLRDLSLRFRLSGLLSGRAEDLTAAHLLISMPADSAEKVAVAAATNAAETARAEFNQPVTIPALAEWLSLPLNTVQIDELVFMHPAFSARLNARLTAELWRVSGSVQLDDQPLPWQTEIQLQQGGDWLLMLSEQQTLLAQSFGHIEQDASHTRIHLDQRLDMAALSSRLPQLANLPLPLRELLLNADITLPNSGVLPRDAVAQLNASLSTREAAMGGGIRWQRGDFRLQLHKDSSDGQWQWQLSGEPQQLQLDASTLSVSKGVSAITLRSQQSLSGWCNAELSLCEGEGELSNRLLAKGATLADIRLQPALNWQRDSALSLVLPLSADISADGARLYQLPLQRAQLSGELIALTDPSGDWQLSSIPGFAAELSVQAPAGWTLPPLQLQVLPQLYVHGNLNATRADEQLSLEPLLLQLAPVTMSRPAAHQRPASQLRLARSLITCLPERHRNGLNARCDLSLKLKRSDINGWPVPDVGLSGPVILAMNEQSGSRELDASLSVKAAAGKANLRLELHQDLLSGRGNARWHLQDLPLSWSGLNLNELTALTGVELLGGGLSGQGWIDWQPGDNGLQITPDLMLRADNISAIYDSTVAFDGWNTLIALRRPFNGDYLLDAQISGKSLNPGIELKDILARSQTRIPPDFSYAVAEIQEMHTDVLGGRIHTPLIRFDTRKEVNAFGIELEHIQLSQIAALESGAEVKASGTLDGVLPVVLSKEGPSVPGGSLFARSPGGYIRYNNDTSDALGSSDQTMGMAMTLLENFQYDQLQSNIQYQPDGQLLLGLQFQGKNPDFFGGQKTHLNVNLEYNLLDLLESLRVTQDVISKLESKYQ